MSFWIISRVLMARLSCAFSDCFSISPKIWLRGSLRLDRSFSFFPRFEPSFFSRSSSIAKSLIVKDSMMPVAHFRNWTARSELTL
jgi:hypothetical protein